MAEAKKAGAKRAKSVLQKADLVEMAAAPAAEKTVSVPDAEPASRPDATAAASLAAAPLLSSVREQGDAMRKAMGQAAAVSAQGLLEVNDKIISALHAQSHAVIDLWRGALTGARSPDDFQAQTSATRQAYEAASAQWKDIAETTTRWVTRSLEPLQSAMHR